MGPIKLEASDDLESSVQVGRVLAGKYRVDRVLGVGGMGVVVAATHLQLDQQVALKFIRREALMNLEIIGRFEREARAAVRLKSEHVARIIDVGRLETGSPYIVMEYLEGKDLAALLEQYGTLVVSMACDVIIQACDAIAEAHSLGIVHRDLKPGNLFLANTSHGQQIVKVLDFGISKCHAPAGDPNMTRTQAVMGSPGYMSPEQMRSTKNVDGRSDVWSLGVILYELVAGRLPFQAETFTALCLKIAMDPLPPLPALPVALPPGFAAVIERALEKDPVRRHQSAIELAQALAPFANAHARELANRLVTATSGVSMSGAHLLPTTAGVSTLDAATGQARGGTMQTMRGARKMLVAGAGLLVAAAIGVGVGATGGHTTDGAAKQPRDITARDATRPVAPTPAPSPARPIATTPVPIPASTVAPTPAPIPARSVAPTPAPIPTPAAMLDAGVGPEMPKPPLVKASGRDKQRDKVKPIVPYDPFKSPE